METITRNASLNDLMLMLQDQQARKIDVVAPASALSAVEGQIRVRGTTLDSAGVTTDGLYVPTTVADEGFADKLGVPVAYLKRLRAERPDLYDANVNGWLHGRRALVRKAQGETLTVRESVPGDPRSFLLRCFRGDGEVGIARALLSDRFMTVDNIDVLMSVLDGIRTAGVEVNVTAGNLTERRMYVDIDAPEVAVMAPTLLKGYRSPFTGETGADNPLVSAGLRVANSEVGNGAFTITPRITVLICRNGMTMTKDAARHVHLGGQLEHGTVIWAEDTQQQNLALIKSKSRDAVASFLSHDYVINAVDSLSERAEEEVGTTLEAVTQVVKPLGYSKDSIEGIMDHFVRGGQFSRAGVVNAITSYSQTVGDGDTAYDLDSKATQVLV